MCSVSTQTHFTHRVMYSLTYPTTHTHIYAFFSVISWSYIILLYSQILQCIFLKNKNILLHNLIAVIKLRKNNIHMIIL